MKDIDFDELDKAVNSLMNQTGKSTSSTAESASTAEPKADSSASTTPVQPSPEVPAETKSEPAAELATEEGRQSLAPAPARKRSGRFMDMVHPSADMKAKTPVKPISREGVSIAPTSNIDTAISTENSADTPAPVANPASEAPAPVTDVDANMPDPIDMHTNDSEAKPEDTPTVTEPSLSEVPDDVFAESTDSDQQPGESPFLSDAKVEKRPLGGEPVTGETQPDKPGNESEAEPVSKPEELDQPTLDPAPAELGADVVAVEASEPKEFAEAAAAAKTDSQSDSTASDPNSTMESGAINQQYKEQPSSSDTRHAAIYDAETYPATGAKVPKKKSGWMWVLWIFILLSLGAGGAVALYMMNII